ncbi:MAG: hypothetical protein HYW25_06270 [Candidatus Aenigmarchaeota archaeon]|nr:hypothetical protein [Candidatus Aenigmarchaeota archaeon]
MAEGEFDEGKTGMGGGNQRAGAQGAGQDAASSETFTEDAFRAQFGAPMQRYINRRARNSLYAGAFLGAVAATVLNFLIVTPFSYRMFLKPDAGDVSFDDQRTDYGDETTGKYLQGLNGAIQALDTGPGGFRDYKTEQARLRAADCRGLINVFGVVYRDDANRKPEENDIAVCKALADYLNSTTLAEWKQAVEQGNVAFRAEVGSSLDALKTEAKTEVDALVKKATDAAAGARSAATEALGTLPADFKDFRDKQYRLNQEGVEARAEQRRDIDDLRKELGEVEKGYAAGSEAETGKPGAPAGRRGDYPTDPIDFTKPRN